MDEELIESQETEETVADPEEEIATSQEDAEAPEEAEASSEETETEEELPEESSSETSDYTALILDLHDDLNSLESQVSECSYLISALLFFLLFEWCSNRIRCAVKYFCGRKIDE